MKTVALFGGSFDPPHIGHKAVVEAALQLNGVTKVVVMPTYLSPFKRSSYLSANERYRLLKEMFQGMDRVEISTFEIEQKRKVASIESVEYLLESYAKIYLIIGADNLASLTRWHRYDELEQKVTFVIATRGGIEIPKGYRTLNVDEDISSTQIRKKRVTTLQERIQRITDILDTNKAEKIEVFDLRDKEYIVDYAIIASSLGTRHTLALLDHLKKGIKPEEQFNNVDESGDWVVIDLGDILIHIMTPEYRIKYDMESFLSELGKPH